MKYVEEWKRNELERSMEWYKELLNKYNEVLEETKMSCNYHNDRRYFENVKGMSSEECHKEGERLYRLRKEFERNNRSALGTMEKFLERDRDNCGYEVFGTETTESGYVIEYKCYKSQYKINEEKEKEVLMKLIDKHFETLQNKVEKKIGKIIEIEGLGGYNYRFIGEEGKCNVEVILAGGYNIQRLHTRWIITKNLDR